MLHGVAVPVAAEIALGFAITQARIDHSQERLFGRLADRVGHGLERKSGIVLAVLVIFGKGLGASSLRDLLFGEPAGIIPVFGVGPQRHDVRKALFDGGCGNGSHEVGAKLIGAGGCFGQCLYCGVLSLLFQLFLALFRFFLRGKGGRLILDHQHNIAPCFDEEEILNGIGILRAIHFDFSVGIEAIDSLIAGLVGDLRRKGTQLLYP